MCGIAGFLSRRSVGDSTPAMLQEERLRILREMTATLEHRGPDSRGEAVRGPFAGGMQRLSINDLHSGDQPLTDETRSVWLLYNGEIYNSPELRRELEGKGYRFKTRSDGEVICHLWHEHGEGLFERLDGMYAAALWIDRDQKLILARDIPGEKPLYWADLVDGGIAFASEVKALEAHPGVNLDLNIQSLWDMPTFLWIPEPDTAYLNVRAIPRGHALIVDGSGRTLRKIENRFNVSPISEDDADVVAETKRIVNAAVESRLLSDVPVGSFLSGGLDSSIVATIASRKLSRLDTFTVGFEDLADPYHGRSDESKEAAEYAAKLGTRHHTIRVDANAFRELLPRFVHGGDQPFAVSSGLGILAVARAAREAGIRVLLTGDGADECFGGYSWYAHLQNWMPGSSFTTGDRSFQNVGEDIPARIAALSGLQGPACAWAWHYYASENEKARLFHADVSAEASSSLRWFQRYKQDRRWSAEDFIRQDREFYFPFEMMRKADRMTMEFSVEGRLPFAAPSVLSHVEKLSMRSMVRDGSLKWALRAAFADDLGSSVASRPKHGFNVPIDHWLKKEWSDLLERTFSSESALSRLGLIRKNSALAARDMLADPLRLNGHTLFSFICMNLWLESKGR